MTGVEKIVDKILSEGRAAADEIQRQADLSIEELRAASRAQAEAEAAERAAEAQAAAEEEKRRVVSLANLEARKQVLQTRQALLDDVYAEALAELNRMEPARHAEVLAGLAAPLCTAAGVTLVLSEKNHPGGGFAPALKEKLAQAGKPMPAIETADLGGDGGFLVRDGDVEINCTFAALVAQSREGTEREAAALLF